MKSKSLLFVFSFFLTCYQVSDSRQELLSTCYTYTLILHHYKHKACALSYGGCKQHVANRTRGFFVTGAVASGYLSAEFQGLIRTCVYGRVLHFLRTQGKKLYEFCLYIYSNLKLQKK